MRALNRVGLYVDFVRKAFRQRIVYRTDVLFFMASSFVLLFVEVSIWRALFASRTSQDGITFQDMVTYVVLGMLINAVNSGHLQDLVATRIEDGTIANDFIRPISFKFYMLAQNLGENALITLLCCLPACIFGVFYWGISMPKDPRVVLLALAAVAGGTALTFQLNYTLALTWFWFKSSHHVDWFYAALQRLFSGAIVPLWFYPTGLRSVSEVLPWQLISFSPLAIYLGKISPFGALRVLLYQALWFGVLLIAEQMLWRSAQAKIEVYGG